jgi:hypothetical protein
MNATTMATASRPTAVTLTNPAVWPNLSTATPDIAVLSEAPIPESAPQGSAWSPVAERIYLDRFWNEFSATPNLGARGIASIRIAFRQRNDVGARNEVLSRLNG